jgi:indole-3-glycerol phosphate synthase
VRAEKRRQPESRSSEDDLGRRSLTSFLDRVVRQKEAELAEKKRNRPVRELERRASALSVRDFRDAIAGGGAIIAEIKRKSPSVAGFRQKAEPEELASVYEAHGASAISIVTDERNFGTCLADVDRVRGSSRLPVLVKDFIVDTYQVIEARAAGADALLLIARILPARTFASLLDLTHGLGMSVLAECHDEEDIEKATVAGATIIGLNNRDLGTLDVSIETTGRLVSKIPEGALSVSESGIDSREAVEALLSLGVDAFLVGGALLDSDAPGEKLRELLGLKEPGSGDNREEGPDD